MLRLPLMTLGEELTNETDGICLHVGVRSSEEKFRDAPWPDSVGILKISPQVFQCARRARVQKQRMQLAYHIRNASSVVPQRIEQVVSILVLAANMEGERLENHKRARATNTNVASGCLPDTFAVAVRGHNGWSKDPNSTAKFALAVTIEEACPVAIAPSMMDYRRYSV